MVLLQRFAPYDKLQNQSRYKEHLKCQFYLQCHAMPESMSTVLDSESCAYFSGLFIVSPNFPPPLCRLMSQPGDVSYYVETI